MLWITENDGVICVTTILMCDSMNEERMFEGGNAMEEPMKKLKNIMELNNTLCECIFRKNCASVPEERSAIPLQTEQSSAG